MVFELYLLKVYIVNKINQKSIEAIVKILGLHEVNIIQLTKKINYQISLNKNLYKNLIYIFFIVLKIIKLILFFIPSLYFYTFMFRILSKSPSPLNLVYKLLASYIILDSFE